MSKLVKVTDEVGAVLEERAQKDGVSLAGEIKLLLDGKDDMNISRRLDNMATYLDGKFKHLESLIEDTTIERIDRPRRGERIPIEYDKVWNLFFEILDDDDKAWFPYMSDAAHNSDCLDEGHFFLENGVLISDDMFGKKQWVRVSEEMEKFLI